MRYFDIEDVTFTNKMGRSVKIKGLLPVPVKAERSVNLSLAKGDQLDEIATRTNIYGEGYESKAYDIFAENIEELTQVDFNLDKLKKLRIPF